MLWIPVRNSLQVIAEAEGKGIAKVSIHVLAEHVELLDKVAAVENAVQDLIRKEAEERDERVFERKIKWSRKELAENLLKVQVEDLEERVAAEAKHIGALPDPEDKKAVASYAARLLEHRTKKRS